MIPVIVKPVVCHCMPCHFISRDDTSTWSWSWYHHHHHQQQPVRCCVSVVCAYNCTTPLSHNRACYMLYNETISSATFHEIFREIWCWFVPILRNLPWIVVGHFAPSIINIFMMENSVIAPHPTINTTTDGPPTHIPLPIVHQDSSTVIEICC